MDDKTLPWPELFRPTHLEQIVGNTEKIASFKEWLLSWQKGIPKKRAALLIGPPGVGKTASVVAIANDLDFNLVEFNASDKRNKASIEKQVWSASTQDTLDGGMRLILLDEVDGLSGTSDRGGVGAILKVIRGTVHPIVMTANDPESPRLKDLLKVCRVFTFESIQPVEMLEVLKRILEKLDFEVKDQILEEIIENSGGDLRAAISDLETQLKGDATLDEIILHERDVKRGIKDVIRRLMMANDITSARGIVSQSDVDYEQLLLWLDENLHLNLTSHSELSAGFEALSIADLIIGRIFKGMNWKLLSYVFDFLSAGVAISRKKTPYRRVDYTEPKWPLLVWQGNRKRDKKSELLVKLSRTTGVSRRRVQRTHLDIIERIVARNPGQKGEFASWLGVKKSMFDRKGSHRSR